MLTNEMKQGVTAIVHANTRYALEGYTVDQALEALRINVAGDYEFSKEGDTLYITPKTGTKG